MNRFSREIERLQTDYNTVQVMESEDGTIDFDVIGATHATWHPRLLLTGHAWDAITAATLMGRTPPQSLLLLGLGGGTVLRQLRFFLPETRMTAVEIDPGMIHLARTHMAVDELELEIIEDDAYAFLKRDARRFDRVIDDLYRCGDTDVERPAPVTSQSITQLQRHLTPEGLLVMNFVLGTGHRQVHQSGRKAFCETFTHVRALQPPLSHNEILAGTCDPAGLGTPHALRAFSARFPDPSDQKRWKELRNLKLR